VNVGLTYRTAPDITPRWQTYDDMRRFPQYLLVLTLCTTLPVPAFTQDTVSRSNETVAELQKLNAVFTFVRKRNTADYAVTAPNGIDESKYVMIGGIEQWISIRGEDRANPVLLFLHGGPGEATNLWAYATFRPWLKKFTVVQWDQRGAGRTLGKNGPSLAPTITVDRMVHDGIELSELLRTTLKQDKLILVGHSWGSILGILMVKARPDLFHAFVGTGQVTTDPATNYAAAYDAVLKKAEAVGNQRAIGELKDVGPPPWTDGRGFGVQRKWANMFEHADDFLPSTISLALTAPGYSLSDVNDWLDGQALSADQLVPQTRAIDAKTLGGEFRVPIFVIQGAEDFTTPTSLARSFESSIRSPRKAFVPIEEGGHFAVFMKSDAFLAALVRLVYPLVNRP
jgi:pimeloyl-ACP methyl ester carboxylesterase